MLLYSGIRKSHLHQTTIEEEKKGFTFRIILQVKRDRVLYIQQRLHTSVKSFRTSGGNHSINREIAHLNQIISIYLYFSPSIKASVIVKVRVMLGFFAVVVVLEWIRSIRNMSDEVPRWWCLGAPLRRRLYDRVCSNIIAFFFFFFSLLVHSIVRPFV